MARREDLVHSGFKKNFFRLACASSVALLVELAPAPARGCMTVCRKDEQVQIRDQEIAIAWNSETHREEFVRRANFDASSTAAFGFLVPTPTKPELAEAPDALFDDLAHAVEPPTKHRFIWMEPATDSLGYAGSKGLHSRALEPVRVLEERKVAGFDAVVLEADDAAAFARWLADHGFATTDDTREWAEPYVAQHWKITAFKFEAGAQAVSTAAIRMSFATDEPLFPFRVGRNQRTRSSTLRVYYVGKERVEGRLGRGPGAQRWPADIPYSRPAPEATAALRRALSSEALADGNWLTEFRDTAWPSGGDDLYFVATPFQTEILPPPRIVPVVVGGAVAGGGFFLLVLGLLVAFVRARIASARPPA